MSDTNRSHKFLANVRHIWVQYANQPRVVGQQVRSVLGHLIHELMVDEYPKSPTVMHCLTFTRRFRAAFEFKNAKSTAAWSIKVRLVASGNLASRAVRSWEGPCGASSGEPGGEVAFGVPGVGVGALITGVAYVKFIFERV